MRSSRNIRQRCSLHARLSIMGEGLFAMLTLAQLALKIDSYSRSEMTLEQFQNWFERNCSRAVYETSGDLSEACFDIDGVFSSLYLEDIAVDEVEAELMSIANRVRGASPCLELANAIRPFEHTPRHAPIVESDAAQPYLAKVCGSWETISRPSSKIGEQKSGVHTLLASHPPKVSSSAFLIVLPQSAPPSAH